MTLLFQNKPVAEIKYIDQNIYVDVLEEKSFEFVFDTFKEKVLSIEFFTGIVCDIEHEELQIIVSDVTPKNFSFLKQELMYSDFSFMV